MSICVNADLDTTGRLTAESAIEGCGSSSVSSRMCNNWNLSIWSMLIRAGIDFTCQMQLRLTYCPLDVFLFNWHKCSVLIVTGSV